MNNQHGPFKGPFAPNPQTGESPAESATRPAARLGHKTNLRGVQQGQTAPTTPSPDQFSGENTAQQSFQSAQQQQGWGYSEGPSIPPAQQPWNEEATQHFQPSPVQPSNQFGHANGTRNLFSQPQTPAGAQAPRTPTGQLGPSSSLFSNPMFPKGNSQPLDAPEPVHNEQVELTTRQQGNTGMLPGPGNTGALMHPAGAYSGDTGMLTLHQPVKVVRIPIAGRPGEYKTGILPVLAQNPTGALPPHPQPSTFQGQAKKKGKVLVLIALVVLVLFGSGIFLLTRPNSDTTTQANQGGTTDGKPNAQVNLNATATANLQATATFENSLILKDPLDHQISGWKTTLPNEKDDADLKLGMRRAFKNGAYHISSITTNGVPYFATSILLNEQPTGKYTYSVDTQQIKGPDDTIYNFFGLLFSYNDIKGKATTYAFLIINNKNDRKYEFRSLDGRKNPNDGQWSTIKAMNAGGEFHGPYGKNTLKVQVDGSHFTFLVNGKQVGTAQNKTYGTGSIGLGINGLDDGSEVAFSNLLLYSN